jgi:hypothetical protein
LQREELRQHHEIAFVVRRDVDEVGDLALEVVAIRDPPHLVLDRRDPHLARSLER